MRCYPALLSTVALTVMLSACNPAAPEVVAKVDRGAPVATPAAVAVTLAPTALSLGTPGGSAAPEVAFGMPMATVIAQLTIALGTPTEQGNSPECGPGALDFAEWPGNLTTYFNGGNFTGWTLSSRDALSAGSPRLTSVSGIGIGSTRAAAEAAYSLEYFEDSLGPELMIEGMSIQLDGTGPTARITSIMAGDNCAAR